VSGQWLPAEHGSEKGALQAKVAHGLKWTLIDTWGTQLLGLLIFVFLARLLDQIAFGLVALAAVFVTFAQLFVDQGMGVALIQRRVLTRSQIDTAFWVAVVTGTMLTLLGIVLAAPLATLLGEPALAPILQVLSLSFVLAAFDSIQVALMRREMRFRSLAIRKLSAVAGGGAVGLVMAFAGFGAWALVGQQLASAAIAVIALWTVSPWRPGLRISRSDFRELFSFGLNVVGGDVLNFLSANVDRLLIGAYLGAGPLGFYAFGYRILDTGQSMLVNFARKLAFPIFSRLQHDQERLRRAYARVSRALSIVILPGYIGLALVAQEAIVVIFGQRWAASGPVAAVLFLIGPVQTVQLFSRRAAHRRGPSRGDLPSTPRLDHRQRARLLRCRVRFPRRHLQPVDATHPVVGPEVRRRSYPRPARPAAQSGDRHGADERAGEGGPAMEETLGDV